MEPENRNRKNDRPAGKSGVFRKLFAHIGDPEAIEDEEWYLDSADVRLTRIFSVILVLHIIAVGGILAFKMVGKASVPRSDVIASASSLPRDSEITEKELAGKTSRIPAEMNVYPNLGDPSAPEQYLVKAGDTLMKIAVELGVTSEALRMANGLDTTSTILPGMWLHIPTSEFVDEVAGRVDTAEAPTNHGAPDEAVFYQVKQGDTAWAIAKRYKIDYKDLLRHNQILRPESLQIGQRLRIPPE